MAQLTPTDRVLPHELLDRALWEIASQEGLTEKLVRKGWPEISSRDCGRIGGRIGGRMVRVMINYAEGTLADGGAAP